MTNTSRNTTTDGDHRRGRGRKGATLGVIGGLVAGTAAGLIVGVPGLTSAASPVPAVVQQVDDTTAVPDADTPDEAAPARADFAERLRTTLDPLVEDGTITAAQADAVAQHLVDARPASGERGGRGGRDGIGRGPISDAVTEVLGLDAEALRDELRAGNSLADVATAQGVDVQLVIDAMIDDAEARLDAATQQGRITAEEAAERAASIEEKVTAVVNGERPARPGHAAQPEG